MRSLVIPEASLKFLGGPKAHAEHESSYQLGWLVGALHTNLCMEVFATLYKNLGIDVNTATVDDLNGRPRYLVDENRQPIKELY